MKIIVDTSAWYAYFVVKDLFHQDAVKVFQTRATVITSNIVLEEVLALLHHRQGKKVAMSAADMILELCGENLHYLGRREDQEILEVYKKTKAIDYVDASVIWLAQKLDLPIFTFDRHFRKLQLQLQLVP